MSTIFDDIHVDTWGEFKAIVNGLAVHEWIFRGQREAAWDLETTLERLRGTRKFPLSTLEEAGFAYFKRVASIYAEAPLLATNQYEWFAVMQHYGVPTRLLDWTSSAYVAAYFALENASTSCAIWLFNRKWLDIKARELLADLYSVAKWPPFVPPPATPIGSLESQEFAVKALTDYAAFPPDKHLSLLPVDIPLPDRRQYAQHCLFLLPTNSNHSLGEHLSKYAAYSDAKEHFKKITLSATEKAKALEELASMNVRGDILFPTLDGLGRSTRVAMVQLLLGSPPTTVLHASFIVPPPQ